MLTIVVPTKNRSAFVKRMLSYYALMNCEFPIILGDSSDDLHLSATQEGLKQFGKKLKIKHLIDPHRSKLQVGGWQKDTFLHGLIDQVETPYVAFYADDDFAVINNLQSAVDFLAAHKDYSFVCGRGLLFRLKSGKTRGEVGCIRQYRQRAFELDRPADRLFDLFSNYAVLEYGVSRTDQKKYRWNKVFDAQVDNLLGELINCSLVVLQGKVHMMNKLLLVRQGHAQQTSLLWKDRFDWVEKVVFAGNYARLRETLAQELVAIEAVATLESARELVKKCFWFLIAKLLISKWPKKYENQDKLVPAGISNGIRRSGIFKFALDMRNKLSASRFSDHKDFLPIYDLISSNGKQASDA